jgi:hypothetical protein
MAAPRLEPAPHFILESFLASLPFRAFYEDFPGRARHRTNKEEFMSLVRLLTMGLAAAGFAAAAHAHINGRLHASEKVEINAPAAKVWAVIGNFQDLNWHPAIEKTEGKNSNQPKATRHLTLKGGATIDEELQTYNAPSMVYKYRILKVDPKVLPITDYVSRLSVKAEGEGKSVVEWKSVFAPAEVGGKATPDETAIKAISGVYRGGLDALKKKLESPQG